MIPDDDCWPKWFVAETDCADDDGDDCRDFSFWVCWVRWCWFPWVRRVFGTVQRPRRMNPVAGEFRSSKATRSRRMMMTNSIQKSVCYENDDGDDNDDDDDSNGDDVDDEKGKGHRRYCGK